LKEALKGKNEGLDSDWVADLKGRKHFPATEKAGQRERGIEEDFSEQPAFGRSDRNGLLRWVKRARRETLIGRS
jgi:hypothetical protein